MPQAALRIGHHLWSGLLCRDKSFTDSRQIFSKLQTPWHDRYHDLDFTGSENLGSEGGKQLAHSYTLTLEDGEACRLWATPQRWLPAVQTVIFCVLFSVGPPGPAYLSPLPDLWLLLLPECSEAFLWASPRTFACAVTSAWNPLFPLHLTPPHPRRMPSLTSWRPCSNSTIYFPSHIHCTLGGLVNLY